MNDKTLDIVILPEDEEGSSIISFLDLEEKGLRWYDEFMEGDKLNIEKLRVVSYAPYTAGMDDLLDFLANQIRTWGREARDFLDDKFSEYYDTSLSKKDKEIVAGLFAAQFYPGHLPIPHLMSPKQDFRKSLATIGAVAGGVLTFNPVGALVGAFLGYFSPSIAGGTYYVSKKMDKVRTAREAHEFKTRCLGEITRIAGAIDTKTIPINHYFMHDYFEDLFPFDEEKIYSERSTVVTEDHPEAEPLIKLVRKAMKQVLGNKQLSSNLTSKLKFYYEQKIAGFDVAFPYSHSEMENLLWQATHPDEYGKMLLEEKAVKAAEEGDFLEEGEALGFLGKKDEALQVYLKAADVYEREGDREKVLESLGAAESILFLYKHASGVECLAEKAERADLELLVQICERIYALCEGREPRSITDPYSGDFFHQDGRLQNLFAIYKQLGDREDMIRVARKIRGVHPEDSPQGFGGYLLRQAGYHQEADQIELENIMENPNLDLKAKADALKFCMHNEPARRKAAELYEQHNE